MVKELPQVASEIIPELKAFEVSSYEDGDCIAEEIAKFDGCKAVVGFAVWDGHSVKYCRVLPGPEENSCYAPICDDAVVKKAVKLPSAATDYGTEAQLLLVPFHVYVEAKVDVS